MIENRTLKFQDFAFEVIDRMARLEEGIKSLGTKSEMHTLKQKVNGMGSEVIDIKKELVWYRRGLIAGLIWLVMWLLKTILKLS